MLKIEFIKFLSTVSFYLGFSIHSVLLTLCRLQCCSLKALDAPGQRPLSPLYSPKPPTAMLAQPCNPTTDNGLCGKLNHHKDQAGPVKSASIRDKISQWEGKKEPNLPGSAGAVVKDDKTVRNKEHKPSEPQRTDSKKFISWERQDSGKENVGRLADFKAKSPEGPMTNKDREVHVERRSRPARPAEPPQDRDKKSVLTHVKKLERATKGAPDTPSLAFPGNYFCPPSKEELEESEKKAHKPIFGTIVQHGSENVYNEPGTPSINPLPKPQRTFQHHTPPITLTSWPGSGKVTRNLPPLPSIPPPPLPTCRPPGVCRRPWTDRPRDSINR